MMANYGAEESHIQYRTFIPRLSFLLVRIFVWRLYQAWRRGETAQNAGTRTSQTVQPGQND